ncbi:MAG: Mu transposase domain-containing protein [Acidimicrobiales bacterium]
MLTHGEDVEAHALKQRGWTISAIARHLGRDRKTVRAYINGTRVPGVRQSSREDPLEPFVRYITLRFVDDPHVWASALYDEVRRLGYPLSYPTFVRQVRAAGLRPHCEACHGVKGRDTIEIDHPPGEEIQWDWFERRNAPWGSTAYVLLGTLPHSGRIRGVLAEKMDQPHLIEAMDAVLRRLGGTAHVWRTDRLATVIVPGTRDVQASFAPVAKHYEAIVEPCPPRRGNRKGSVESSVRFTSGRWWRTMTARTPEEAQRSLDTFLATTGDDRVRRGPDGERTTVGALADAEPLLALPPAPFPATTEVSRVVADNATVAYQGNRYSVPPGLSGTTLVVRHRLSSPTADVVAPSGAILVTHRLAPPGSGALVRSTEHRAALEAAVLSSFTTARPCDKKANRPPGHEALAEAARLLGPIGVEPSVDLSVYGEIAEGR